MTRTRRALLSAAPALVVLLSACGPSGSGSSGTAAASSSPAAVSSSGAASPAPSNAAPFGAGCAALTPSGTAGLSALAGERLSAAAAQVPALRSLLFAVTTAHLADSLDSLNRITILAPANGAFAAVPHPDLTAMLADTARLTRVLTHHVLEGRLTPAQMAGTHTTLANDTVTITGTGEQFAVSAGQTMLRTSPATVVCGNIRTANATVYVIDQVLAPPG